MRHGSMAYPMNNNTKHRYMQTTRKSRSAAVKAAKPRNPKNKHGKVSAPHGSALDGLMRSGKLKLR